MRTLNLDTLLQAGHASGAGTRVGGQNAELPWRT